MKVTWFNIIILATLVIMAVVIWKGCNNSDAKDQVLESTARVNDSLKFDAVRRDSADLVRNAMWRARDSVKTAAIDSMKHLLSVTKDSLKSTVKTLKAAVKDLGTVVAGFSDSALQHQYDSVSAELDRVYLLGGTFVNGSDSTIQMLGSLLNDKDSVIMALNLEIIDLKKALTACTTNFDGLQKDTENLNKKIKVRGLLNKIGATVAAVLAAILILK